MTKRKLRWNREIDTGEQVRMRYRYTVAILNEPGEINKIRRRFHEQLRPTDDVNDICDCVISDSNGLHWVVFAFSSEVGKIRYPEKIYRSEQFRRDQKLVEKDEMWAYSYICSIAS